MLSLLMRKPFLMLCIGICMACEPENDLSEFSSEEPVSIMGKKTMNAERQIAASSSVNLEYSENLQQVVLNDVIPTECGATKFSEVQWKYMEPVMADPLASEQLDHYLFLNRQAAILGIGSDEFGENGEFTKLVQKLKKDLERFWKLQREIKILGQHNHTLNDREKLADIYWFSIQDLESKAEAYKMADEILEVNRKSSVLPDSPFLSSDGFSAQRGIIVIGDGLVKLFSETGLDEQIVWTGILTHEWAHQVQFEYLNEWQADYPSESISETTRAKELEADFLAGYYMTHKRGATYNWKRAEEFFELYYQSGDCSFEFEQHHGTPLQRKNASYEGYLLAESAKKKGYILSPEALHEYFFSEVLPGTVSGSQYF